MEKEANAKLEAIREQLENIVNNEDGTISGKITEVQSLCAILLDYCTTEFTSEDSETAAHICNVVSLLGKSLNTVKAIAVEQEQYLCKILHETKQTKKNRIKAERISSKIPNRKDMLNNDKAENRGQAVRTSQPCRSDICADRTAF